MKNCFKELNTVSEFKDVDCKNYILNFPDDYTIQFSHILKSPLEVDYTREAISNYYKKNFKRDIFEDFSKISKFFELKFEESKKKELSAKEFQSIEGYFK